MQAHTHICPCLLWHFHHLLPTSCLSLSSLRFLFHWISLSSALSSLFLNSAAHMACILSLWHHSRPALPFIFFFIFLSKSLWSLAPFVSPGPSLPSFIFWSTGKKPSVLADLRADTGLRQAIADVMHQHVSVKDWKSSKWKRRVRGIGWEAGKVKGEGRRWRWNDSLAYVRILFAWVCFGWLGIHADLLRLWAGI